ncbi:DUF4880 domain-containing protein [Xinfangfangia sp. D13-10-4-6]|uniref:FecR family protein n=1 Tax=Pseudogemmobacter hezensis TaxID=2737662 RepID=UPI0015550B56|nr:FecR domain-containing protein [Pseudogemmobacter hezensis]NPD17753.1 DUF4880 domain-containing protein [Pseudogemmobacter hezensis]
MSSPDDQALEWLVRLNDTKADDHLREEFARWHAVPEHAKAWTQAEAFWNRLNPVTAEIRRRRRLSRRAAIAGGSALVLAPLTVWLTRPGRFADYRTLAGETRELLLPDGSRVELAAGSALSMDYATKERRLVLHLGEAFFKVATDPERPFIVNAGQAEFIALGTAFNVRLFEDQVSLTVTEHRVLARNGQVETVVEEGHKLAIGGSLATNAQPVDIDTETAWRQGILVFEATPLGEVMDVLGRNAGWNVMISDAARRIPVTAIFKLSRISDAPETIARTLPVRLSRLPGGVIIIRTK